LLGQKRAGDEWEVAIRELEKVGDANWPVALPTAGDRTGDWAAFLSTGRLLVFVLLTAIFTLTAGQITDPDFWWHLRTGQLIFETRDSER